MASADAREAGSSSAISEFVKKRAVIKRKITINFAAAAGSPTSVRDSIHAIVSTQLENIQQIDDNISAIYSSLDCDDSISPDHLNEITLQSKYTLSTTTQLKTLKSVSVPDGPVDVKSGATNCELKLPSLVCGSFSGEGTDNLEYTTFLTQFNNIVGLRSNLTKSTKFTYLKTYLKGYALKVIQHLLVTDDNYSVALSLLEKEFLNKDALIDDLFTKLLFLKPKYDSAFLDTKIYINEVRCIFSDLKVHDVELLDDSSSLKLVSHIVFSNLPANFRQELARKVNNNYPSLIQIFDNYVDVIRTLNIKISPSSKHNESSSSHFAKSSTNTLLSRKPDQFSSSEGAARFESKLDPKLDPKSDSKWDVRSEVRKMCKLCSGSGHSMIQCRKYGTHESRVLRCNDIKVCSLCTSTKHTKDRCPRKLDYRCIVCQTKEHVSALCPKFKPYKSNINYCINATSNSPGTYLLPTLTIDICKGNRSTEVRCLVDTGSQRSYISASAASRINLPLDCFDTHVLVSTFVNSSLRKFSETCLSLDLRDGRGHLPLPVLVDEKFDLKFDIDSLPEAINNISSKFRLADTAYTTDRKSTVQLEGLIGSDIIQFFDQFNITKCLNGSAFKFCDKLIPFGNIDNFLSLRQVTDKYCRANRSPNVLDERHDSLSLLESQIVNSVMSPKKSYFDPVGDVVKDSDIESNLDQMFRVESLGITDDSVSDFDSQQINKFREGISLVNGKYHVILPWYPDKISDVKSNFAVARSVLTRVVKDLKNRNLFDDYNAVFRQQLSEGIVEKLDLTEINCYDHVWIPHRPVIKLEQQVTTKIRPVLNCSLKIGNTPSLNQASYPGIDLLTNLLSLLINIRSNAIFVGADIRKAFLQIHLSRESDKNKFSILWLSPDGELIAYRYRTIVFGLAASPFILNFVIQHHVSQFDNDETNEILSQGFYVDNLFFTGNDAAKLREIFHTAYDRMISGGFELCSWFSNDSSLRDVFANCGRGSAHESVTEKVLGYMYSPISDELSLANVGEVGEETPTKRVVLSIISRVFDPLGLANPVSVKSRIYLRKLWQDGFGWDIELPFELAREWKVLCSDLLHLSDVRFPRRVVDSGDSNTLVIFCDASKEAYGFATYGVARVSDRCVSNLLFSKVKVSPIKSKSLPTLELLAIFLAFKCLRLQLSVKSLSVTKIYFCSDSQVALTWILSNNVKSKNIFASNRVKDINNQRKDILSEYSIECLFRYVPTDMNPADLVTRGLSFTAFLSKLQFWQSGPCFLSQSSIEWPRRDNGCFSEQTKSLVSFGTVGDFKVEPIFPIDRFSKLQKLFRVTSLVLHFVDKLRKIHKDKIAYREQAKMYWINYAQRASFPSEISFLTSHECNVPPLVKNLNLFLDDNNLLRAKGRLDKCVSICYDLCNPIMLPRDSFLTVLFVREFHSKCKHLGESSTLNTLRNHGYWLPKGRAVIKRILSDCIICKRINAFSFAYPKRTDFVGDKVNFVTPFRHTGVDYTGHFFVKFGETTSKFYLLIFTCLNIRAIHLELVPSMSTSDFLLAFIKFCNIYNIPKSIYSDNAGTFLNATKILNASKVDDPLNEYLVKNSIRHVRIPVYSAWVGSAWERLIRVVKSSIYKSVGRKKFEFFQFNSLLSDVQNAVNGRPLTYRDTDLNNVELITPNSFLKLGFNREIVFSNLDGCEIELPSRKCLIATLNKREDTFEVFKTQWYESYLLSLRESSRDVYQHHWVDRIQVGDVVLIHTPTRIRAHWPIGRVTQLLTGSDAKTRCVRVKRSDATEEVYSINHLYPLELSLITVESTLPAAGPADKSIPAVVSSRPQRAAALKCREAVNKLYNS